MVPKLQTTIFELDAPNLQDSDWLRDLHNVSVTPMLMAAGDRVYAGLRFYAVTSITSTVMTTEEYYK
jgi:hypothetical protein